MRCKICQSPIEEGRCTGCGTYYVTRCPDCGNTLEFEAFDDHGVERLRCARCDNDSSFELVASVDII